MSLIDQLFVSSIVSAVIRALRRGAQPAMTETEPLVPPPCVVLEAPEGFVAIPEANGRGWFLMFDHLEPVDAPLPKVSVTLRFWIDDEKRLNTQRAGS